MTVDENTSDETAYGDRDGRESARAREHAAFRSLLQPDRIVPVIDAAEAKGLAPSDDDAQIFHRVIGSAHAVPHFEPLEGAGQVPGLGEDIRRRRSKRRTRHGSGPRPSGGSVPGPPKEPRPARPTKAPKPVKPEQPGDAAASDGRRETFILVAVVAVLIALAAIYLAQQKSDQPHDSGIQGASLVISQPDSVRA